MSLLVQSLPLNLTLENKCIIAYGIRRYWPILILLTAEIVLSFFILFFIYCLVKDRSIRHVWAVVCLDLKILGAVGLIYYILGATNAFLLHSYKLSILLMNFSECFYVWNGPNCFWFNNFYGIICSVALMLFHCALLVERSYACLYRREKNSNGLLGLLLALCIICLSPVPQSIVYDSTIVIRERFYCGNAISTTSENSTIIISTLVICDLIITTGDFLLFKMNRHQIKHLKETKYGFDLKRSFALREMEISIKVIYPFSLAHAITYCMQRLSNIYAGLQSSDLPMEVNAFNSELINFSRICTSFLVISFLLIYTKSKGTTTTFRIEDGNKMELHFREFNRVIA